MVEKNKAERHLYKCTQCGTLMPRRLATKPLKCTFCGSHNIINVDQGDRSTRFGETKPAKIVTK